MISPIEEQHLAFLRLLDLHNSTAIVRVSTVPEIGRGLICTQSVKPGQLLLTLPRNCLINVKTYRGHFNPKIFSVKLGGDVDSNLSSVQALSLLLSRAKVEVSLKIANTGMSDQTLRLFVQTLPRSFNTVPLFWAMYVDTVGSNECIGTFGGDAISIRDWKREFYTALISALPRQSQTLLKSTQTRFRRDWERIKSLRDENEPKVFSPGSSVDVLRRIDIGLFLWAWHCVNTRCVYMDLGLSHEDNITLVPLLDMANHTSDPESGSKVSFNGGVQLRAPAKGCITGEECRITYGPHSNTSLLDEYGFVLPQDKGKTGWKGNRYADVLVDEEVEEMFNTDQGKQKIELLMNTGYWGDFSIHPYDEPRPSYRLVAALRLLVLPLTNVDSNQKKWEATITGYAEEVSVENEKLAHEALFEICERRSMVTRCSRVRLEVVKKVLDRRLAGDQSDSCNISMSMVEQLLNEEEQILELVKQTASQNVEW